MLFPTLWILPRLSESLHPGGQGSEGNPGINGKDMTASMRTVFYPAVIGWTLLGVWISTLQIRYQIIKYKKEGPFMTSLNDASGRAQLGALLTSSKAISTAVCQNTVSAKNNPLCSDAYGASLLSIKEIP